MDGAEKRGVIAHTKVPKLERPDRTKLDSESTPHITSHASKVLEENVSSVGITLVDNTTVSASHSGTLGDFP